MENYLRGKERIIAFRMPGFSIYEIWENVINIMVMLHSK